MPDPGAGRGVQSLARAVDLLDHLADAGGRASLSQLATVSGLPAPPSTASSARSSPAVTSGARPDAATRWARGWSHGRVGHPRGARRRRRGLSRAGALAPPDADVHRGGSPRPAALHGGGQGTAVGDAAQRTEPRGLVVELAEGFDQHGYVVDDGEQEVGVRCVAAPVPGAPSPCAVSVSGPVGRLGAHDVTRIGALVREAADRLGGELAGLPAAPGDPRRPDRSVPSAGGRPRRG